MKEIRAYRNHNVLNRDEASIAQMLGSLRKHGFALVELPRIFKSTEIGDK